MQQCGGSELPFNHTMNYFANGGSKCCWSQVGMSSTGWAEGRICRGGNSWRIRLEGERIVSEIMLEILEKFLVPLLLQSSHSLRNIIFSLNIWCAHAWILMFLRDTKCSFSTCSLNTSTWTGNSMFSRSQTMLIHFGLPSRRLFPLEQLSPPKSIGMCRIHWYRCRYCALFSVQSTPNGKLCISFYPHWWASIWKTT